MKASSIKNYNPNYKLQKLQSKLQKLQANYKFLTNYDFDRLMHTRKHTRTHTESDKHTYTDTDIHA